MVKSEKRLFKPERNIYERRNAQGEIYLQVKLRVPDPKTGKKSFRSFGTFYPKDYKTKTDCMKEARRRLAEVEADLADGKIVQAKKEPVTVNECYLASLDLAQLSMKTKEAHNNVYAKLVPPDLKNKNITRVTAEEVQRSLNKFAEDATEGAINDAMTIWRQIYDAANKKDLDIKDRSRQVTKPKAKVPTQYRSRACTADDLTAFLAGLEKYGLNIKETRYRCKCVRYALIISYYEGLRPQEVLALSREDIDLVNMNLHIRKSVGSSINKYRQIIPTKTTRSTSVIPIAEALRPTLEELLEWSQSDPLLADFDGKPFEIDVLANLMSNARKRLNLPYVTLGMMRHSAATDLYNSTLRKVDVQGILRHTSVVTTEGYVNQSSEEQRRLINSRAPLHL